MLKKTRISLAFTGALLAASLLTACGDDSSTDAFANVNQGGTTPTSSEQAVPLSSVAAPASSATQTQPESSATAPVAESSSSAVQNPEISSSATTPPPSSSAETAPLDPNCVETPVATIPIDSIGLADIADVFKTVRCNEKAVFVV